MSNEQTTPAVFDPVLLQAAHKRLVRAKELGLEPDPSDVELAERVNASPYALRDRPWARDDY